MSHLFIPCRIIACNNDIKQVLNRIKIRSVRYLTAMCTILPKTLWKSTFDFLLLLIFNGSIITRMYKIGILDFSPFPQKVFNMCPWHLVYGRIVGASDVYQKSPNGSICRFSFVFLKSSHWTHSTHDLKAQWSYFCERVKDRPHRPISLGLKIRVFDFCSDVYNTFLKGSVLGSKVQFWVSWGLKIRVFDFCSDVYNTFLKGSVLGSKVQFWVSWSLVLGCQGSCV